jgi:hypothetical protein
VVVFRCFFLYIKLLCGVEMCVLFLWNCKICIMSCMCPNERWCVAKCRVYFEDCVLYRKDLLCLLNLVQKSHSVCPVYASLQSGHVNL